MSNNFLALSGWRPLARRASLFRSESVLQSSECADSEADVLAHMDFPLQHRTKIHSTNPLERLNKEVKRRADVVGIFPSEGAIIRLIGAVLLEANDEWQLQHRYMQTEAMTDFTPPLIDAVPTQIAPVAACPAATSTTPQFPPR